eukprot:1416007-Amphidinium_carterae.1
MFGDGIILTAPGCQYRTRSGKLWSSCEVRSCKVECREDSAVHVLGSARILLGVSSFRNHAVVCGWRMMRLGPLILSHCNQKI